MAYGSCTCSHAGPQEVRAPRGLTAPSPAPSPLCPQSPKAHTAFCWGLRTLSVIMGGLLPLLPQFPQLAQPSSLVEDGKRTLRFTGSCLGSGKVAQPMPWSVAATSRKPMAEVTVAALTTQLWLPSCGHNQPGAPPQQPPLLPQCRCGTFLWLPGGARIQSLPGRRVWCCCWGLALGCHCTSLRQQGRALSGSCFNSV